MVVFVLAIALEISPEAAASPNYVLAAPDYVPESDLEEEPLLDDLSGNNIFETARLEGEENGKMILDLIDKGLLVYPMVLGEDGQTKPKKYFEFSKEQLQDECDVQATSIILPDLPPDVYLLVNHQEA
nr:hypothetical protein [Tanacetum cinerariifolium]